MTDIAIKIEHLNYIYSPGFHSCGVQDMPVEMAALLPSTVMRQSMFAVPSAFTFFLLM